MSGKTTRVFLLVAGLLLAAARPPVHAQPAPEPSAQREPSAQPEPDAAAALAAPAATGVKSESALDDADLAALGIEIGDSGIDTSVKFGGFADFTSIFPIRPRGAVSIGVPRTQTFYVGNVNLYISKNLSSDFRMMGEVRLSYLPNGALSFSTTNFNYISTAVADYADNSRVTTWGGIVMQRLYLEWTLQRMVVVRAGQFLTPYGIWNVDHGSPVYIPVQRPYAVNRSYFPERQTGLEIFGRWDASNRSTLGYHLTLSNGGGPVSEYREFDKNKALGARLYWEHHGAGFFRLGVSGYYGMETASTPKLELTATSIEVGSNIGTQFYSLAFAGDIIYTLHGFHFQAEWVSQQRKYTDAGRTAHGEYFAPVSTGFSSNSLSWAAYALVAYTIPWFAVTPYVMTQYTREVLTEPVPDYILSPFVIQLGVSFRPIDAVVIKVEWSHAEFHNGGPVLKEPTNFVQLQAAWAF